MSTIQNIDTIKSRMRDVWNEGDYGTTTLYAEYLEVDALKKL